jgi:hypothetical protein
MANISFDSTKVAHDVGYTPLPADTYTVVIVRTEIKPTRAGDGELLSVMNEVIEGKFSGRKIFDNLNLVNKSSQAVEIAQKKLSAICHAVGVLQVVETSQLHDIPLRVTVRIKEGRNEVTGYAAANTNTATTTATPATQHAAANSPALKPWQKSA